MEVGVEQMAHPRNIQLSEECTKPKEWPPLKLAVERIKGCIVVCLQPCN